MEEEKKQTTEGEEPAAVTPPTDEPQMATTDESEPATSPETSEPAQEDKPLEEKWKEHADAAASEQADQPKEKFRHLKHAAAWYWARKKWTLPVSVLVLILLTLAVPFTRYPVLGLAWKKTVPIAVVDSSTGQPVTGADVAVGGKHAKTDNHGVAKLKLSVGGKHVVIAKKYYKDYSAKAFVGLLGTPGLHASTVATGRLVPITVVDYITGKPVENAVVKAAGGESKTDKQGKVTLALPTKSTDQQATISGVGFNAKTVNVLVTSRVVATNKFTLTPAGKLYFLSNQSGKIDVVKTDLDGANRKTVLAGTGTEDTYSTSLLASRDWKYLALLSKRDGKQGIYLIDTSSDQTTNIDGGNANASFTLVGWSGSIFVYQVQRSNVENWQNGASVIKSYDAASGKLYSLDQTQGEGSSGQDYGHQSFSAISLLNNEVVFAKDWASSGSPSHLSGKSVSLVSVHPDGSGKKTVKDFPIPDSAQYYYAVNTSQYEPYGVYLQVPNSGGTNDYYEYEDGAVTPKSDVTDDTYNKAYPTYLISPGSKQTFWSDVRDNKNTLFIGNSEGEGGKQIAMLSDYVPYGWYTENYLLVSKNGSELYVMPTDGSKQPSKVTDYYKPQLTYKGYGGGYGGQ